MSGGGALMNMSGDPTAHGDDHNIAMLDPAVEHTIDRMSSVLNDGSEPVAAAAPAAGAAPGSGKKSRRKASAQPQPTDDDVTVHFDNDLTGATVQSLSRQSTGGAAAAAASGGTVVMPRQPQPAVAAGDDLDLDMTELDASINELNAALPLPVPKSAAAVAAAAGSRNTTTFTRASVNTDGSHNDLDDNYFDDDNKHSTNGGGTGPRKLRGQTMGVTNPHGAGEEAWPKERIVAACVFAGAVFLMLVLFFYTLYRAIHGSSPFTRMDRQQQRFATGAVSSDHPICSAAGADMLLSGGTAVDAAVATAFCLGALNPFSSGLGGGGYMLVHSHPPTGVPAGAEAGARAPPSAEAIDYRETAPESASWHSPFDGDSSTAGDNSHNPSSGGRAIGIPGEVAGLYYAHSQYGRLSWAEVLQPAIDLSESGFDVTPSLQHRIDAIAPLLTPDEHVLRRFLTNPATGALYRSGETMVRRSLAVTLNELARNPHSMYNGSIAIELIHTINRAGGNVSIDDFQLYGVRRTLPLLMRYNTKTAAPPTAGAPAGAAAAGDDSGFTILGVPPTASGGAQLALALNLLNGVDFDAIDKAVPAASNGAESSGDAPASDDRPFTGSAVHRLIESLTAVHAAARVGLGDPNHSDAVLSATHWMLSATTPHQLAGFGVADDDTRSHSPVYYASVIANAINDHHASTNPHDPNDHIEHQHNSPAAAQVAVAAAAGFDETASGGSTHVAVMTRDQTVSMTHGLGRLFGAKIMSIAYDIILNSAISDFSGAADHHRPVTATDALGGLNHAEGGKRPLSAATPIIVLRESAHVPALPDASIDTAASLSQHLVHCTPYASFGSGGGYSPAGSSSGDVGAVAQVLLRLLHRDQHTTRAPSRILPGTTVPSALHTLSPYDSLSAARFHIDSSLGGGSAVLPPAPADAAAAAGDASNAPSALSNGDVIRIESGFPSHLVGELSSRGHTIQSAPLMPASIEHDGSQTAAASGAAGFGAVQIVMFDQHTNVFVAAADPRTGGQPAGV